MPLTNDLTDKIFGKIKFEKKIIHDLWDEHIVKKGIGVMLEERAGKEVKLKDFERILSYLEDAPWKDNITKHEHLILYENLTKLISDIILQLLSYMAEDERRRIKERQNKGKLKFYKIWGFFLDLIII